MPGVEVGYKNSYDIETVVSTPSKTLMSTYSHVATMASVNADTRYPEKTVEFLIVEELNKQLTEWLANK